MALPNNTANFPVAVTAGGLTTKQNGTKFTWPTPTGLWGLMAYVGFFVSASGGAPEYWFQLDIGITVNSGNTPVEFDVGQLIWAWGS